MVESTDVLHLCAIEDYTRVAIAAGKSPASKVTVSDRSQLVML